jgi:predicted metal-dependent hydrolase
MRARDALGRHVEPDSPDAVEPISEEPLPPLEAIALARELIEAGRAFSAHEVFEARWKAADADERDLWQGLAQLCVGLTHLQRRNPIGASTLLRRGVGHLGAADSAYGIDLALLRTRALELADDIDAGATIGTLPI